MTTTVEPSGQLPTRTAVVDDLCDRLERSGQDDVSLLCAFAREFFAKVPRQLLLERSLDELAALTVGAWEFLRAAPSGRPSVQVLNPEEEGWEAPVTVIRAEVSDRPFIVDTIREYLGGEGLAIQHYIYPVLGVERDGAGNITWVGEPGRGEAVALEHCEVSRIADAGRRAEVRDRIEERLHAVVAATSDFPPMRAEVDDTIRMLETYAAAYPGRRGELEEIGEFLRWLKQDNFIFLGYRAYEIVGSGDDGVLRVEPGTGLGILRREEESAWSGGVRLDEVAEPLRRRIVGGPVLITSKTNAESPVHRRGRMDYVGVKRLDADGRVVGERRFLGLFTSKAFAEHADAIPILRRKLEAVLRASGAQPGSHDYKEIITIFNSMPKEDLFQASQAELEAEVQTVLSLLFTDEVQVTLRPDPLRRGVSIMVILPRGKFSGEVRHRIQEALAKRFQGAVLNYHLAMSAGDQARLHFYLSAPAEAVQRATPEEVAAEIRQIIRSWDDRLADELARAFDPVEAHRLAGLYGGAFSDEYRAATLPEVGVQDLAELERMRAEGRTVAIALREPRGRGRAEDFQGLSILKLYLLGERLVLSDFMPLLENAGVRVVEVTPFALAGADLPPMMIYSFAVQAPGGGPIPLERGALLAEALLAVREGDATNDPYNALVLHAGLRWREVDVLRTYGNYAFQIGAIPTRYAPARALARYPELAGLLVEWFHARFAPDGGAPRPADDDVRSRIDDALDAVTTLADDRAIRRLAALVDGTTRTNYFRHGGADPTFRSGGVPYLSLKFRSADVEELRRSRLLFEIYVFSARMEGIHLRAAPVSRGGLRWSDRPDDFRTEVMGLVQTQIVKNAVIVPSGSKGGFITKRTHADRDEMMEEAADQYRTLIRGMLDVTDNLVDGAVVPPEGVVRHDGDDPYLVVAADKGTAHLSDVANAIAQEYGFWLGDAFASGGSHGYDHKVEGITARGAWECVRRHFREMGKDIQSEPFTVVGIGDMSGDVFGNGMLLSRQIRLLAAFDHRHVFLDPDPDPETSFRERERVFALPRSSWEDYDRAVLSPGAMIVPRASKEVEITPEARAALGLDEGTTRLDGEALVRAVLRAPAELLWNGGIGTYVKDAEETNAEAGDSANDPVRVNAHELRCQVVGEGGNLGFTQRARIAYALRGGRLNTDAIDNSAGVDMSDHEVNLKILLNPLVAAGTVDFEARNALLEEMTDEVSALVLRNNVSQSLAVSLDEARSRESLGDFAALITSFEKDRILERGAEGIPGAEEIAERARDGIGLTRPTLSVLLAYAKMQAGARLLASPLPDDPAAAGYLAAYFPARAVETAGPERIGDHRLRREIVTTCLVSDLVDLMGASFLHRVARDSGQPLETVARAWLVASRISGAAEIRADLERLERDGVHPSQAVYRWLFGLARVLDRTTRWALNNVDPAAPTATVVDDLRAGLSRLRADFSRVVAGEDRQLFEQRMDELGQLGVEPQLAARLITLRFLPELLDILRIAREAGNDPVGTARAYYVVSEELGVAWLQQAIRDAVHDEIWDKRLSQGLLADVARAQRAIARRLLAAHDEQRSIEDALADLESAHPRETQLFRDLLHELQAGDPPPLPACALAVRALTDLAHD